MSRRKLAKFEENNKRNNVIEPGKPIYEQVKGNWNNKVFNNDNPIVLELACGNGEYSTGMANVFPEKNFIGVDVKGDRIFNGSTVAINNNLNNVAFLRCQILTLQNFFEENEVDEIWIVFPDPRPRSRDEKRRLTHPRYLNIYENILKEDSWIRFKTDSLPLFEYTLEVLEETRIKDLTYTKDLYNSDLLEEHFGIKTRYENMFSEKGFKINYLKFKFEN
ncbi:tRNA (guanosine(46)-N7)-methyltransferase TrmB [Flexithrix dorotheae]|uniref:tRNA (guanosine(46)-N7)-methyltransferase TrmB n=1 Tax=Flexithrix dorotheae TaxID=70993 RepID=UPI000364CFB7|nr:tRNA (guanosine(46)-N7)-methyltransferase TrmB [Flexithrix dorotheae]